MVRFFELLDLPIETSTLKAIKESKLIHITATAAMNGILRMNNSNKESDNLLVQLIYQNFNAPNIPRDMKAASILRKMEFWAKLKVALGPHFQGVQSFLDASTDASRQEICSRVQLVVFWALYHQSGHTVAQTFFRNMKLKHGLAQVALDPMAIIPDGEAEKALRSLFIDPQRIPKIHESDEPAPFVTPFGASFLMCGKKGCSFKFYNPDDPSSFEATVIHRQRAEHFKGIFWH